MRNGKYPLIFAAVFLLAVMCIIPVYADRESAAQSAPAAALTYEQAFPDPNFRAYVTDTVIGSVSGSDVIDAGAYAKMAELSRINVVNQGISDLTGIAYFSGLQYLFCEWNRLTELDVSNNTHLIWLNCSQNELTGLDISNNLAMEVLECSSNRIPELNLSKNVNLYALICSSNELTELDISNNLLLTDFDCGSNQLAEIDVSKHIKLERFDCEENKLTQLDVSNNKSLLLLSCRFNELTELDISNNLYLEELNVYECNLSSLDISRQTNLERFDAAYNQLTEIDVSNSPFLTHIYVDNNKITQLDVSNNPNLRFLLCYDNPLPSLDVSKNLELEVLGLSNCPVSGIDLSKNLELVQLALGSAHLTTLDISENTLLQVLAVYDSPILEVDISKNTELRALFLDNIPITKLDTSQNTRLITAEITNVPLTQLSFANSPELSDLTVTDTPLTQLDITNCTELEELTVYSTLLTELDVSTNAKLFWLNCHDNLLKELDVSNNLELAYLYCYDNQLTSIDVTKNTKLRSFICSRNFINDKSAIKGYENCLVSTFEPQNTPPVGLLYSQVFPDPGFRAFIIHIVALGQERYNSKITEECLSRFSNYFDMDLNNLNISDLTGIEYFPNLTRLRCDGNKLTEIDLSKNRELEILDCSKNQLSQLDVSKNLWLESLNCSYNNMTSPDDITGLDLRFTTDFVFEPQNAPPTYTVAFKDYNGTVLKTENVPHGKPATAPAVPVRAGHTFTGWDKAFDAITGDLTVTALYTQNPGAPFYNGAWHIPADETRTLELFHGDWLIDNVFINSGSEYLQWEKGGTSVFVLPSAPPVSAIVKFVKAGSVYYAGIEKPFSASAGTDFDGDTWLIPFGYISGSYAVLELGDWELVLCWTDKITYDSNRILISASSEPFSTIIKLRNSNGRIKYIGIEPA